jgi:hypothetical protein
MKYISFDLATKSLAISIIDYNSNYITDITTAYNSYLKYKKTFNSKDLNKLILRYNELLDIIQKIIETKIHIQYATVVDLIPNKKVVDVSVIERTSKLYHYMNGPFQELMNEHCKCSNEEMIFLLEYQMGPNVKSSMVSAQILYHITKYQNAKMDNIILVGPSLKNKVVIGGNDSHYSNFVEKYTTLYASNKNHTKYNLLKLLDYLDCKDIISGIAKKNIDDIADSVMMSIAYILK